MFDQAMRSVGVEGFPGRRCRGLRERRLRARRLLAAAAALVGLGIVARPAWAQYPSSPQLTKDGTAVVLEDYASAPLSSRTASIDFTNQLGRINFLRSEPASAPLSSSRFFINDLNRNLYTFDKAGKSFTPYLNFTSTFPKFDNDPGFAGGLVTFQFDPEYATNGKFFTVHTEDPNIAGSAVPNSFPGFSNVGYTTTTAVNPPLGTVVRQGVLVEWTDTNLSNNTFEGTAREVLRVGFNSNIHPMGDLAFNPLATPGSADYRNLYISNGDGGAGENTTNHAIPQRLDALQGKVLRITPDTTLRPGTSTISANGRYSVPTSGTDPNPFVGVSGARNEVFAYGFRNPHRMTWDAPSDKLLVDDIGLHSWEEINIVNQGINYGYAEREGTEQLFVGGANNGKTGSQTNPPTAFPSPDTLTVTGLGSVTPTYPVANYSHEDGDAISSGFVYRGTLMPELVGKYIFGDITTGRLHYCNLSDLIANDDGNRTTVATIHEIQVVYDSALDSGPLQKRRTFDIVADEYAHKGGDPKPGDSRGVLPGLADVTGGWSGSTFQPGTFDIEGVQYGGGRSDIRLAMGGDGELYLLSKSDGMVRRLTGTMHFWNIAQSGTWSTSGNWTNGVAGGAGAGAYFDTAAAPRSVTLDGAKTVGLLYLNSAANAYTFSGNVLFLDATSPRGAITDAAGNHTLAAPLVLLDDATVTVTQAADTLTISNFFSTNKSLTKAGAGTLAVNHVLSGGLSIEAGTVRVLADGTAAGTSRVDSLAIAAGAKFDIGDNHLLTPVPAGSWNGSSYDGVTGMIVSGRNGGSWTGSGIVTSQTLATSSTLTGIGVASAADVKGIAATATSLWSGQTVTGSDTLVMYTYGGDANLDGKLNVDDYGRIDSNIGLGTAGWYNGDFNYDGKVNVDDYGVLDSNIGVQGAPFFTAGDVAFAATAVPEPATAAGIVLVTSAALFLRRRRSPASSILFQN
jgi:autotransporter-associated beta strand protein